MESRTRFDSTPRWTLAHTTSLLVAEHYRGQMTPTDRCDGAVSLARQIHHGQTCKGTDIPYLSHLLAVAGLLMEHEATEDRVIAGS